MSRGPAALGLNASSFDFTTVEAPSQWPGAAAFGLIKRVPCAPDGFAEAAGFDFSPAISAQVFVDNAVTTLVYYSGKVVRLAFREAPLSILKILEI